jgi:hypothetical protein
MNPIDLIKKSVETALVQDGYSPAHAMVYAKDAAQHFKTTTKFKHGAYADCLAHARKMAKQGVRK